MCWRIVVEFHSGEMNSKTNPISKKSQNDLLILKTTNKYVAGIMKDKQKVKPREAHGRLAD